MSRWSSESTTDKNQLLGLGVTERNGFAYVAYDLFHDWDPHPKGGAILLLDIVGVGDPKNGVRPSAPTWQQMHRLASDHQIETLVILTQGPSSSQELKDLETPIRAGGFRPLVRVWPGGKPNLDASLVGYLGRRYLAGERIAFVAAKDFDACVVLAACLRNALFPEESTAHIVEDIHARTGWKLDRLGANKKTAETLVKGFRDLAFELPTPALQAAPSSKDRLPSRVEELPIEGEGFFLAGDWVVPLGRQPTDPDDETPGTGYSN